MRGQRIKTEDERFNLQYRPGGGYPVDEHDGETGRDSISQMGMASHRPDVLYNAMRAMGCQVFDGNRVRTGCGGFDYHA